MKTIIFSTVALCLTCLYVSSQDSLRYEIVETKIVEDDLPEGWFDLVDNNGYVAGRYLPVAETKERRLHIKYIVKHENRRKVTIEALHDLIVVPTAGRIITAGEICGMEVDFNTYLKIYDMKGKLIASTDRLCGWPFCIAVADNGDIALAGPKNDKEKGTKSILYKFDKDGNKLWEVNFEQDGPYSMFISKEGNYTILFICNSKEHPRGQVIYFDASGTILYQEDVFSFRSMQFINNNKILTCTRSEWKLMDISQNFKTLNSGTNLAPALPKYAVNLHPDGNMFSIIEEKKESKTEVYTIISTYNINTGEKITSYTIKKRPSWPIKRMLEFKNEEMVLKFDNTSSEITLKLK